MGILGTRGNVIGVTVSISTWFYSSGSEMDNRTISKYMQPKNSRQAFIILLTAGLSPHTLLQVIINAMFVVDICTAKLDLQVTDRQVTPVLVSRSDAHLDKKSHFLATSDFQRSTQNNVNIWNNLHSLDLMANSLNKTHIVNIG